MEAMGIIFSNIYDSKMGNLTWERTSGSIPFGGRYRQIDFVLSNMSNSGIRNIGIITKYNYQSLMDHLANCEDWDLHLGENVRFLPPYATGHTGAYRGKLEALQTALPVLERSDAEYVILSDTTVLCAIDFSEVVDAHVASVRDLTVVAKAGRADGRRTQTLALKVDESGKVVDLAVDYCAPKDYLSGMSMFVIERKKLLNIIQELVPHGKCYFERDFVLPQYNEESSP
ncbi:MAG: sugar phosphate nucleotidyltransferase [Oscillospiraceae bacterium]